MSLPDWMVTRSPRIIMVRGFECRFVVVRAARYRPCWTLRLQCFDETRKRWLFTKLPFYACVTGRYEYCSRPDATRNLILESHVCEPIDKLPTVCNVSNVLQALAAKLAEIIEDAWAAAEPGVYDCFGKFGVPIESLGYYLSMEYYEICQYNRCYPTGQYKYGKWRVEVVEGAFRWEEPSVTWDTIEFAWEE